MNYMFNCRLVVGMLYVVGVGAGFGPVIYRPFVYVKCCCLVSGWGGFVVLRNQITKNRMNDMSDNLLLFTTIKSDVTKCF